MKYLIYLIIFAVILVGVYFLKIDINLDIANYAIYTTLDKLILLVAIIWLPIHLIRRILKSIIYKIRHEVYIRNIISFINSMESIKEKNTLIEILKHADNNKFLKQIKEINNLLLIKKYDKALGAIDKVRVKSYNETLLLKYRCLIYKAQKDSANFIIYAKKGIMFQEDSLWFVGEMFELVYKNKTLDSEIVYLYNVLKSAKDNNHEEYKKYFCLVGYFYAQFLLKTDAEKAKDVAQRILKEYPDFAPMAELLINIYVGQSKNNRIIDVLKSLWKANQSFEVIKLWQKYYEVSDDSKIIADVKSAYNDIEQNNLLIAGIYAVHDKFLEAHNILQNSTQKNATKNLVELDIMQRESNFKTANKTIEELLKLQGNLNFWDGYTN
ncbi:MAG: hypothetical protein LBQ34_01410 [Alphaproteobacteria bacterium]|jgi:hypothetical protein|nr:hypothetical protein [Alphaproteobacteria bacterium]